MHAKLTVRLPDPRPHDEVEHGVGRQEVWYKEKDVDVLQDPYQPPASSDSSSH